MLVRKTLETSGNGRVLVIDGGGSLRCALVGGNLAVLAEKIDGPASLLMAAFVTQVKSMTVISAFAL